MGQSKEVNLLLEIYVRNGFSSNAAVDKAQNITWESHKFQSISMSSNRKFDFCFGFGGASE